MSRSPSQPQTSGAGRPACPKRWALAASLSFLATGLSGGPPAQAAPEAPRREARPKVILLSLIPCCPLAAWPGAEARLADELRTLSVAVEVVRATGDATAAPEEVLAQLAEAHGALAAVRITCRASTPTSPTLARPRPGRDGHVVVIAWYDQVTGKTSIRRGRVTRRDRHIAALVALRAVELLRSSLLELRGRRPATKTSQAALRLPAALLPPITERTTTAPPPRRWALRVAGSLAHLPGGTPLRGGLLLALRWWAHPHLSLEITTDLTPFGRDVVFLDRRTSVRLYGASLALLWEAQSLGRRPGGVSSPPRVAWPHHWRVQPAIGLLAGARLLRLRGQESLDLEAHSADRGVLDLAGVAQVAVRLVGPIRVRASLQGGVLLPRVGIRFPTARVATIGAAYLAAHLGLELTW